ncbi:ClbS/DfsB family four-helix bundle protein [Ktedonosporobacter rubrisoli]|uniref:ClbS/DfsB family four-helix bundle protein n=1 Tax=Ktedonosporobacter rubrisoli TaxID=2509675 RepID=A0A4P6JXL2_KTERU|nr:ClbS/DfsB family four-helix bundle protein [Ktedonosporobacter rubrisoli]QBD80172.1 ClbS/DfsB family four-helix bundle protein [Ktedonosporobacter rubrisoli]
MAQQKSKAELLEMRRALYTHFDALIADLSEQQMQMPGVTDGWSVKDHIAHLTFWERVNLLEMLKAIEQGISWTDPGFESTEEVRDKTNEQVYLQNKDRPLADVLAEFQATHQQVLGYLEKLNEGALKTPYEWLGGRSIITWLSEPGGHYEEHEQYIRDWLAWQSSAKE